MAISLKPEHLKRYRDMALLFIKYGHSDIVAQSGLDQALVEEDRKQGKQADPKAEELATDLERMGPIYVKLGQVLSSRPDILPTPYVEALARLQDNIEPFEFAEVEKIVQEELGVRLSKAFGSFDQTPVAAASLGQVHRATLRDGREVVVKVQRPGIRGQIAEDLEAMHEIAQFVEEHTEMGERYKPLEILDEFKRNLIRELDYRQEGKNLEQLAVNLREFTDIVIPRPVDDYTTGRVLTMDFIRGRKITDLSPLVHLSIDGARLAESLFRAYLNQILVDGFFHADPHPGNVFITDDGRIALIDLGMIGRVSPGMQEQLLKFLLAISDGRSDDAADIAIRIGERRAHFNEYEFRRRVSDIVASQQNVTVQDIKIGRSMLEFTQIAGECGIRMPSELTMLSKTLLNLDELGRTLDPRFDPNDSIRRNSSDITNRRLAKSISPSNMFAGLMEAQEFAREMPRRVNRILDSLATNQLKFTVDAIDEGTLIEGFQKVANRITTGLILAALIIGASMLMRVETSFRIFGYPGLAILCFLAAAGGGFWLVIAIMINDREVRKNRGKR
jgi:predicted unusual protein kinase regulating ubiquinone biosynthesis (AarF/ABC1/UbiB family)